MFTLFLCICLGKRWICLTSCICQWLWWYISMNFGHFCPMPSGKSDRSHFPDTFCFWCLLKWKQGAITFMVVSWSRKKFPPICLVRTVLPNVNINKLIEKVTCNKNRCRTGILVVAFLLELLLIANLGRWTTCFDAISSLASQKVGSH